VVEEAVVSVTHIYVTQGVPGFRSTATSGRTVRRAHDLCHFQTNQTLTTLRPLSIRASQSQDESAVMVTGARQSPVRQ
jgi:hypothetical protein